MFIKLYLAVIREIKHEFPPFPFCSSEEEGKNRGRETEDKRSNSFVFCFGNTFGQYVVTNNIDHERQSLILRSFGSKYFFNKKFCIASLYLPKVSMIFSFPLRNENHCIH